MTRFISAAAIAAAATVGVGGQAFAADPTFHFNSVTLVAKGAGLHAVLTATCEANSQTNIIVQFTQKVNKTTTAQAVIFQFVTCTGAPQTVTLDPPVFNAPFHKGVAVARIDSTTCGSLGCAETITQTEISISK